jgi:hypothetical protein
VSSRISGVTKNRAASSSSLRRGVDRRRVAGRGRGRAIDGGDQSADLAVEIASGRDLRRIQKCESAEALRQRRGFRHPGAVDQHRNDRRASRKRGFDLDPNRIALLADSRFASVLRAQPFGADDRQNDVGAPKRCVNVGAKIDSDRDAVDVHEHAVLAVMSGKAVEDAPRDGRSVRTAVRDRDLRHRRYLAT